MFNTSLSQNHHHPRPCAKEVIGITPQRLTGCCRVNHLLGLYHVQSEMARNFRRGPDQRPPLTINRGSASRDSWGGAHLRGSDSEKTPLRVQTPKSKSPTSHPDNVLQVDHGEHQSPQRVVDAASRIVGTTPPHPLGRLHRPPHHLKPRPPFKLPVQPSTIRKKIQESAGQILQTEHQDASSTSIYIYLHTLLLVYITCIMCIFYTILFLFLCIDIKV